MTQPRKAMLEELQRRNLSPITIGIYLRAIEEFAEYYKRPPDRLGREHISTVPKLTFSPIASWTSSASPSSSRPCGSSSAKPSKGPGVVEDLPSPKRPIRLPEVLSREEVEQLIQCAASPLHRIWLLTLYATGVRLEESRPCHLFEFAPLPTPDVPLLGRCSAMKMWRSARPWSCPFSSVALVAVELVQPELKSCNIPRRAGGANQPRGSRRADHFTRRRIQPLTQIPVVSESCVGENLSDDSVRVAAASNSQQNRGENGKAFVQAVAVLALNRDLSAQQRIRAEVSELDKVRAMRFLEDRVLNDPVEGDIPGWLTWCPFAPSTRNRVEDTHLARKPRVDSFFPLIADQNRSAIPSGHRSVDSV